MKKDTTIYYVSKTFLWISLLMLSITFFVYFLEQTILLEIGWKSAAITTFSSFINAFYYLWITFKKLTQKNK